MRWCPARGGRALCRHPKAKAKAHTCEMAHALEASLAHPVLAHGGRGRHNLFQPRLDPPHVLDRRGVNA